MLRALTLGTALMAAAFVLPGAASAGHRDNGYKDRDDYSMRDRDRDYSMRDRDRDRDDWRRGDRYGWEHGHHYGWDHDRDNWKRHHDRDDWKHRDRDRDRDRDRY